MRAKIQLHNMDCMTALREMGDNQFDLAIVDPPYGRGEDGGTNRCHAVKQRNGKRLLCTDGGYSKKRWDSNTPDSDYFRELLRVSKHQIIWGANYYPFALNGGAIVWDKVNDGADQSDGEIAYCSLNERVDFVRYMWRGMMQGVSIERGTVQQGNKKLNERRIHPTQKPVLLYKWLLENYAEKGQTILDTHLGSGSIAIACWDLGFDLCGYELDADYYASAFQRLEEHKKQGQFEFA